MNVLSLKFVQKMEIQSDTDVERKMDGLSQKKQLGGKQTNMKWLHTVHPA